MGLVLSIAIAEFALLISSILCFSIASQTSKNTSPCKDVNNTANLAAIVSGLAFFIVLLITLFYL